VFVGSGARLSAADSASASLDDVMPTLSLHALLCNLPVPITHLFCSCTLSKALRLPTTCWCPQAPSCQPTLPPPPLNPPGMMSSLSVSSTMGRPNSSPV
jgi:hypothetical protein